VQAFFSMTAVALPLTPGEVAIIRPALEANAPSLVKVREAMSMPSSDWASGPWSSYGTGRGYSSGSGYGRGIGFFRQRGLLQLLYTGALLAHTDGDDRAALGRVEELLFMARASAERPTFRAQLGGYRINEVALATLSELIPSLRIGDAPGQAPRAQVEALIADLLNESPDRDAVVNFLRVERARQLDVLLESDGTSRRQDGTPLDPSAWGESLPMPLSGSSPFERLVSRPLYLGRARDSLNRISRGIASLAAPDLREFIQAFNEPSAVDVGGVAFPGGGPEIDDRDQSDAAFTRHLVAAINQAGRVRYMTRAQRRTAALALALCLYRADHGGEHLASSDLRVLVPQYLPDVPGDPLSTCGEPLVYVPDRQRPRVYSVGEDGIDDGGWPAELGASRAEELRMTDWVVDLVRQPRVEPPPNVQRNPAFWSSRGS
jgi:hypothetical protein